MPYPRRDFINDENDDNKAASGASKVSTVGHKVSTIHYTWRGEYIYINIYFYIHRPSSV